ncbi:MAG: BamA/TamA family outer membrane protein, partial [Alphaproteobacteria bacterium]
RAFELKRLGGSVRSGFSYSENLRHIVRYTLEQDEISNVDTDASLLIKEEEGTFLQSGVSHELIYDTRDNRFDPREGIVLRLRNDLTGLGGDVRYVKSSVGGAYHYSLAEDWTISVDGEVGNIIGLGQDTLISDRYFIGGTNCRGFQFAGIGPRDGPTGDPLGAKQFYTGSLEFGFPLGLPEDFDIRGRLFTDICAAWDLDRTNTDVLDENSPRASVGVGLSWQSPFGPIIIDLGFAVLKEDFDETELFSFSFGTQF